MVHFQGRTRSDCGLEKMRGTKRYNLQCFDCRAEHPLEYQGFSCKKCGGLLEVKLHLTEKTKPWVHRPLSVWRYGKLLPVEKYNSVISLGEGGTGLHHCRRIGKKLGLKRLHIKNEGENPTGSFKDRGMTVAISRAVELNKKTVICASTGNTAASLAAYSARAGLKCIVLVPRGKVAPGKMVQVIIHGAKVIQVKGNFDQALHSAIELTKEHKGLYLMNSLNPFRLEGQKTLAYEISDQLAGIAPDFVVLPVGNGGNISATWKGFGEFQELGLTKRTPRMVGIQAEKSAPIVRAVKKREERLTPLPNPETVATAIRIGSPVNWTKVLRAIRESKGSAEWVTDEEILEARSDLARYEGIFVEPAGAAPVAGVRRMVENGTIDGSDLTVCVATGHGLKDLSIADRITRNSPTFGAEDGLSLSRVVERLL